MQNTVGKEDSPYLYLIIFNTYTYMYIHISANIRIDAYTHIHIRQHVHFGDLFTVSRLVREKSVLFEACTIPGPRAMAQGGWRWRRDPAYVDIMGARQPARVCGGGDWSSILSYVYCLSLALALWRPLFIAITLSLALLLARSDRAP